MTVTLKSNSFRLCYVGIKDLTRMNRKSTRLISLFTAFAIIAFVLSAWCNQPTNKISGQLQTNHKSKVVCTAASSRPAYLAEIRTRFSGFGSPSLISVHNVSKFNTKKNSILSLHSNKQVPRSVQSLWLINQSFLI